MNATAAAQLDQPREEPRVYAPVGAGPDRYLYVEPLLERSGMFLDRRLSAFTDRHSCDLTVPPLRATSDVLNEAQQLRCRGVILETNAGWVGQVYLRLAARLMRHGLRVWLYWPLEQAIEVVDRERLRSYWALWTAVQAFKLVGRKDPDRALGPLNHLALDALNGRVRPVHFALAAPPTPERPLAGTGVYLRCDFWTPIISGGSYGHTCYVAKELSRTCADFVAFVGTEYRLLDELGVRQVVPAAPGTEGNETTLLKATAHYYPILKAAMQAVKPAFIYERICLGNYVGAQLSLDLRIPYIVEYNGSEISMMKSFDGSRYEHENLYLKAEQAAFRQATLISVVSDAVRDSLLERGVEAGKVLVNPNGADLDAYRPASGEERKAIRAEFGWDDSHQVVGFTGTFGGWHGIDVLAAAIPQICAERPTVRFLLIGDGNFRSLVNDAVKAHGLESVVISVGRVPQSEGARLLRACDIYVSPHNAHMVDSRFFGSPTKIFEYMAMAGGIVATRLEQIGEVLSPALTPAQAADPAVRVGDERSVLCTPGSVDEFVQSVIALVDRPELGRALGRHAREAVRQHYSWERHVARLWERLNAMASTAGATTSTSVLATGDAYKNETQRQWDNDPCGSHYARGVSQHTLDWYVKVEDHRYREYAPWMPEVMEFANHRGDAVLEIGGGLGTDLAQFARHGALVTDIDLSSGHLALAQENFRLRGLEGRFIHQDAETLPFPDNSFDLVYSNGVLHHTPHTEQVVAEIYRVLKPGGKVIAMFYAERSLNYWRNIVVGHGLRETFLDRYSVGEVMSRTVERSEIGARPLVKVYSRRRLRQLFGDFTGIAIVQRQLIPAEVPRKLSRIPARWLGRIVGWNLIIKAYKSR
jgi:glycosyltransferase involved in cell wall biosynthesis/ubiquinone/menaquinone biosynthesis C-methylase UbiE